MISGVGSRLATIALTVTAFWSGGAEAQEKTERAYVFGNSLVHHLSDTDETTVPHWMALIAREAGHEFALSGQWGFLRDFMKVLPPIPNWSFKNVEHSWDNERNAFNDVGLTNIWIVPANFIQYQSPDAPFDGENADNISPVEAASHVVSWATETDQNVGAYIYEGWPEMASVSGNYPPSAKGLRAYHDFATGEYAAWFDTFTDDVASAVPEKDVSLIPVSRVLSSVMKETALAELPAETFYVDDAPHGTSALYLMAAMVTYNTIFNEPLPETFRPSNSVAPELRATFPMVRDAIWERVSAFNAGQPETASLSGDEAQSSADIALDTVVEVAAAPITYQETVKKPSLAMGLNGIADWSVQHPFLDLMKTARPWVGHTNEQWGAFEADAIESGDYLDEFGWPKRLPEGARALEAFILTDQPEAAVGLAGQYIVRYEGSGELSIGGRAKNVRQSDQEVRFDYTPGDGLVAIGITKTDPEDHVRNIKVYRAHDADLIAAGVTFNPAWLARIENLRSLRFMDWMSTNGSISSTWDKRANLNDFSYVRRGVPAEAMIELANLVGADPWFNMPHMADDEYFRAFAELTEQTLRPDLRAYVEYSNEVWNFIFPQAVYAQTQAKERWGNAADDGAWIQFAGMRAAEVLEIWHSVFGPEASTRLKRVVATHTDWPGLEYGLLQAPLAVNEGKAQPVTQFDAYAVTGYFGHEMGTDDVAPKILDWIKKGKDRGQGYELAVQKSIAQLRRGSLKELLNDAWPYQADVARKNSLELMMYEGGTHVVGVENWPSNEDLTAFFNHLNYTPEMAELYQELLTAWTDLGGTAFNAFVDVAKPSQWGSWGALRHLQDKNPRHDVLMAYNAQGAMWNDTRKSSDFAHGVMTQGSAHADKLLGTVYADILLGDKGDDELLALGGDDYLHGGDGLDHAVLPGFIEEYSFFREGKRLRAQSIHGNIRMYGVETISFSTVPDFVLAVSDFF